MRITTIVGARPQFIKAAVISRAIRDRARRGDDVVETIVHTGQHFDANMSDVFFGEMDIPAPDHDLGLGGGTHGAMTGRMIEGIESVLLDEATDWVLVYGDTNSTLAGALAASKLGLPVAHVEAGLRSFNRRTPEEINRVVTDHVASLLFAPTAHAVANLEREGIEATRIELVGDVMYDAALFHRKQATRSITADLGLTPNGYVLATFHRQENTDDQARLAGIVRGLADLAETLPVVVPLHPRTRRMLDRFDMIEEATRRLTLIEPLGYLDMMTLQRTAALIATDSGGLQKEAYFNRVPCLTLRDETEWVELVEAGANRLVGVDPDRIAESGRVAMHEAVEDAGLYGDGRAGEAIVERLMRGG